jgi:hypothetical protein
VGKKNSQTLFESALSDSSARYYAVPSNEGLADLHGMCKQHKWVVIDIDVCGSGREATPFFPSAKVSVKAGPADEVSWQKEGLMKSLQMEFARAQIVSYHADPKKLANVD